MTEVVLPKLNQTGANEWTDVEDNCIAIREVINGELDNTNLDGSAEITDANLLSPNNAVYRTIFARGGHPAKDAGAATFVLGTAKPASKNEMLAGTEAFNVEQATTDHIFYFDDADYTVAGKTQKLRIRAQVACNETKAAIKFTFGLYPLAIGAGGADIMTFATGTVVSGSTAEINEPAASTVSSKAGSDFTIPADGAYVLGVVTSGTLTNDSVVTCHAQLQTRSV